MQIKREDVVQAALTVERWCKKHWKDNLPCDCPFYDENEKIYCKVTTGFIPCMVDIEEHLRTRGLKHD